MTSSTEPTHDVFMSTSPNKTLIHQVAEVMVQHTLPNHVLRFIGVLFAKEKR